MLCLNRLQNVGASDLFSSSFIQGVVRDTTARGWSSVVLQMWVNVKGEESGSGGFLTSVSNIPGKPPPPLGVCTVQGDCPPADAVGDGDEEDREGGCLEAQHWRPGLGRIQCEAPPPRFPLPLPLPLPQLDTVRGVSSGPPPLQPHPDADVEVG
jgi:hypothetical protein